MEVRDLSSIWKEYQHDASTYNDWVEWGKYIVKYNKELKETLKNKDGIMLSTMHGSKGLEWKHVFIIDCVEGVCPSPKAETAGRIGRGAQIVLCRNDTCKRASLSVLL